MAWLIDTSIALAVPALIVWAIVAAVRRQAREDKANRARRGPTSEP